MKPWVHAWALGTLSGLTLPIGAVLGIWFTPVRDEVSAAWMALGAGALLFAVTVELYGHSLRELELGRAGIFEMLATVAGALVGAMIYLMVNRWLEDTMNAVDEVQDEEGKAEGQDTVSVLSPSGTMPTESTPLNSQPGLYPRNKETSTWSVNSALAEERKRLEHVSTPAGGQHRTLRDFRDDSFSRLDSFSRMHSFISDAETIKSRGRDKVINRLSCGSGRSGSKCFRRPDSPEALSLAEEESLVEVDPALALKGKQVAFALFLGILVDGVPEGLLMGFLAAEGHLSAVLIISLLVANFPEAFSSASLMSQGGVSSVKIVSMWGSLCVMVGALAGASCFLLTYFFPTYPGGEDLPQTLLFSVAVIEGLTGGAMIACIATVMLPEAFHRAGKEGWLFLSSGFLCTAGFLVAVVMKALEHHYNNTHGHAEGHALYYR